MRILAILMTVALTTPIVRSAALSAADRETLLENLEKMRDAANSKVDARYRVAMTAYRAASSSDESTLELYLKCIEKLNFLDQHKKTSEFLDWKHKDEVKAQHADPAFRLALHYQLRWLMLTLQASSEKASPLTFTTEAQALVDALFRDAASLAGQEKVLANPVNSSEFARAYEIGDMKPEKWPLSPVNLDEIYTTIVFPPLRTPARVASLRVAWIKRIQQEGIKCEEWSGNVQSPKGRNEKGHNDKGKSERKIGMASEVNKNPEYEKFLSEKQPDLQWQMEVDLFRNGDESASAVRMLAHLQKYITHKSARSWGEEFSKLLKPQVVQAQTAADGPSRP